MSEQFKAARITDHVYWVGAIDWDVRDFHGHSTPRGTTYNAYLVLADKVTLIDTVKRPFLDEMMSRVASVVDPSSISYIVSNHSEMDHSGCLPEVVDLVRPEKLFASTMGAKNLEEHYQLNTPITVVKDGETGNIGGLTLACTETRMIHWPDSMFTTLVEEGLLFSNDAFGMHIASNERFIDEVDDWEYAAAKYYANILMPLSPPVNKLLGKMAGSLPDIRIIAPDHGPIWRKDLDRIISLYGKWARRKATRKAVVTYDTMYGSTARMADAVAAGLTEGGLETKVMPLKSSHRSDIVTELLDAAVLVVGSPTMNGNLLPTVADLLTYLKGLKPKGLIGATFGSYGWSGESVAQMRDYLAAIGVDLAREDVRTKFVPMEGDLTQCRQLGASLAEQLKQLEEQ